LLEATGNYLWNHNMTNRVMHSVVESPLSINHAAPTAGGVAQLSGADMAAKFDAWKQQLLSKLPASTVVGAIDIETESSTANKTNFKVKAAIMHVPAVPFECFGLNNTPGNTNFSYITQYTEVCLYGHLTNAYGEVNNSCFYPDHYIVSCVGMPAPGLPVDITIDDDGIACTTSTPLRCLHGGETETFYINGAEQFVENQVDIAAQIFDDIEAEIFPPGPPGSALGPVPIQRSMEIKFKHATWQVDGSPVFNWYQIYVETAVFAYGPQYCW
jgi:hypothetical protein